MAWARSRGKQRQESKGVFHAETRMCGEESREKTGRRIDQAEHGDGSLPGLTRSDKSEKGEEYSAPVASHSICSRNF